MDQVAIFGDKKEGPAKSRVPSNIDVEYDRRLKELKEKYGEE